MFLDLLQDVYYAETKIVKELPGMVKKTKSPELVELFSSHLEETEDQVDRLEQVFQMVGAKPKAKKCHAIEGIFQEAHDAVAESGDDNVRHAAMIADAQAVEHYEIARYGTLVAWATQLHMNDAAMLLQSTLDEEKKADQKLSHLSTQMNNKADKRKAA